eukprot:15337318-Ditylum_brightwellii.AAC.1
MAYHYPIYKAIPMILVNFTNGSCVNSGFQLLHQYRKYVLDTKSHDLTKTTTALFCSNDDDGKISIVLANKVPVSMKIEQYKAKVACTEKKLLACEWNCISGGDKMNK